MSHRFDSNSAESMFIYAGGQLLTAISQNEFEYHIHEYREESTYTIENRECWLEMRYADRYGMWRIRGRIRREDCLDYTFTYWLREDSSSMPLVMNLIAEATDASDIENL